MYAPQSPPQVSQGNNPLYPRAAGPQPRPPYGSTPQTATRRVPMYRALTGQPHEDDNAEDEFMIRVGVILCSSVDDGSVTDGASSSADFDTDLTIAVCIRRVGVPLFNREGMIVVEIFDLLA